MKGAPSILNRIIALHFAAFVVMSLAIVGAAFLLLHATVDRFEQSVLQAHAQTVSRYLTYQGDWKLSLPPDLASEYSAKSGNFALAVIADDGRMLSSSFPEPVHLPVALNASDGGGFSHQQIGDAGFYQWILPKQVGTRTAWIMVAQNLANPNVIVDDVLAGFAGQLVWIALPILALIFLIDIVLLRQQFRPLVEASQIAGTIQPERMPARLPMLHLPREVLPLAEAFNQALERLEKALRAQREFTADAAHELRTPLAILRTEIDVTLDAQAAHRLHGDIDAMTHILDQLLELAELEGEGVAVAVDVNLVDVAREVVSLMAPLALKQGRSLELLLAPEAVWTRGNHHMLARALRNLVENAIRHAPRTGHVIVEVSQRASLIVSDNGPGIAPADHALVFKRFWRRDHDASGQAGLGLAIVAKIVELHRGAVTISRSESSGAAFTITFRQQAP